MARWLFNSDGDAIAFIYSSYVYTLRGDFAGKLHEDGTIWNGEYIGELVADERLFYNTRKLFNARGLPGQPPLPGFCGEPPYKGPCTVPLGFHDVDLR